MIKTTPFEMVFIIRDEMLESVLYIDIQSLPPAGYCEKCGGEVYRPSLRCYRCEEEEE